MRDILDRIEDGFDERETAHEVYCRLIDAGDEIKRLRAALAEAQKHNAVLLDIVKRLGVYLPKELQPEVDVAIDAAKGKP